MIYTGCLKKLILFSNLHNNKISKKSYITRLSIYVVVMGIIKCGKVFAGFFILIENKLEKLKITAKLFSHT